MHPKLDWKETCGNAFLQHKCTKMWDISQKVDCTKETKHIVPQVSPWGFLQEDLSFASIIWGEQDISWFSWFQHQVVPWYWFLPRGLELCSEKINKRFALLEGNREPPWIKNCVPGFMRKLADFEITTELVEWLCLPHPEKVPHLHLNSFASVWSYFSNISSLLNISSIQNSKVFFSETKCLQSIFCHCICVDYVRPSTCFIIINNHSPLYQQR